MTNELEPEPTKARLIAFLTGAPALTPAEIVNMNAVGPDGAFDPHRAAASLDLLHDLYLAGRLELATDDDHRTRVRLLAAPDLDAGPRPAAPADDFPAPRRLVDGRWRELLAEARDEGEDPLPRVVRTIVDERRMGAMTRTYGSQLLEVAVDHAVGGRQ